MTDAVATDDMARKRRSALFGEGSAIVLLRRVLCADRESRT
jgi:hypothetical protein